MFRALATIKKEEGFQSSPTHKSFVDNQTKAYTTQLPNFFPTALPTTATKNPAQALQNAKQSLAVWDPNTRQSTLRDINLASYATSVEVSGDLLNAHQLCKTSSLDNLINTENPGKKIRCGWIYEKGTPGDQPKISQGALGTRDGPAGFVQVPQGKWYWELEDAKKAILGDRCASLTDCKNVGAVNYKDCAYSTKRGIGIPVNSKGQVLYPKDDRLSAPASSLVFSPQGCPAPPAPGSPQYELQRSRDLCTPLENGQLSRDCMLQQITVAGCTREGALYNALINQALPNNYGAGLTNLLSFQKYQQLATPPLLDSVIRQGNTSTQVALDNFKALAKQSSVVENTALNFSARDLCLKKGVMEEFDFCDELSPSSIAPFALDCLQNAFRRAGGQPAGTEYPTEVNISKWNSIRTWQGVLDKINTLKAETQNANETVQRKALVSFLGIKRESYSPKQIGRIPGMEVYWFNRGTNTFIGRRVNGDGADFPRISTGGEVEKTGLNDNLEYLSLVNLRPPSKMQIRLRLETDDGILYTKNSDLDSQRSRGMFLDTSDAFGANWDQPPTTYNKNTCWKLEANGPNYIMGWWQESGGYAHSQVYYSPCESNSFKQIPPEWFTLTQEVDAPMISWQGTDRGFVERRMPYFFELSLSGTDNEENNSKEIPYNSLLVMKKNSLASVKRSISSNSWRTLSMFFVPGNNQIATQLQVEPWDNFKRYVPGDKLRIENGDVYIMTNYIGAAGYHPLRPGMENHFKKYIEGNVLVSLGPLVVLINGNSVIFQYTTSTINAVKTCSNVLSPNTAHYLYVNMRSDYEGQFPNRITFAVGNINGWKNGTITRDSIGQYAATFTTANNTPLFNTSDSSQLIIGDSARVRSAEAKIASIRLFDYELDDRDILRDIKNEWQMAYF
jgi:hypothetical protein